MQPKAKIFAFFGLIASGKSTLAAAWANHIGASYYNSDIVRKDLAGLRPHASGHSSFNEGIYTPEFSRKTYDALLQLAEDALKATKPVVLDASYSNKEERQLLKKMASTFGVTPIFVHCLCPENEIQRRLQIRRKDLLSVSDGNWKIYLKQKEKFVHPEELGQGELITITTDKPVDLLLKEIANMIME